MLTYATLLLSVLCLSNITNALSIVNRFARRSLFSAPSASPRRNMRHRKPASTTLAHWRRWKAQNQPMKRREMGVQRSPQRKERKKTQKGKNRKELICPFVFKLEMFSHTRTPCPTHPFQEKIYLVPSLAILIFLLAFFAAISAISTFLSQFFTSSSSSYISFFCCT